MLHRAGVPVCAEPVGRSSVSATGITLISERTNDHEEPRSHERGPAKPP
jgi:hypothetical protein